MRALFWSELFWPHIGGPEVMAVRLLPALRERGHDVIVLTSRESADLPEVDEVRGIPVHRIPYRSAVARQDLQGCAAAARQVIELKSRLAPDLVHLNGIGTGAWFHLWTAPAQPAPLLVTLHTRLLGNGEDGSGTLQSRVLQAADRIVACSESVLEQVRRRHPDVLARSSVIANSVEAPDLPTEPLPFDPPRILCLGRLIPLKGFDLALEAFASLDERFPGLRLTLAGDGPAREGLERTAARLGIEGAVEFAGWVNPAEAPALIVRSTLVVIPSRGREGLPVVAIQAALLGRPLVVTRVGGLPEAIDDGTTGLAVDEEDAGALARAIAQVLENPATACAMGSAARARAMDRFSWERHVEAYDTLYRSFAPGG